jgi:hypothetical protein
MMGGTFCSSVINILSQKYHVCGAARKEIKNPGDMSRQPKTLQILFLGSIIHAYIRFFECLFHFAYRLEVKMWQVRSAENKHEVATRKAGIIGKHLSEI